MNIRGVAATLILALAVAAPVIGQEAQPGVRQTAAQEIRTPAPRLQQNRTRAADVDARHCLDLPTNPAIIVCAEKYLPRMRST